MKCEVQKGVEIECGEARPDTEAKYLPRYLKNQVR